MITNKVVSALLAGLAVLTVACTVLLGFQLLLETLQDAAAARVLRWIGLGGLILLVTDLVLLIGALGIRALDDQRGSPDE